MPEIIVHIKGDDEPRKFTQSIDEVKDALDKKFSQIREFVSKNNQSDINQAIDSADQMISDPDNRRIFGNLLLNTNPIESVRQKVDSFMKHTPYPNPIEGGSDISAGDIAEFGLSASPGIGDIQSAEELHKAINEDDRVNAILSGVGLLPFVPGVTKKASKYLPENFSLGPSGVKTTPIGEEGVSAYRQTGADDLYDILLANKTGKPHQTWISNDKDLALSQGQDKGVLVEFNASKISGTKNKKPGEGVIGGNEYLSNYIGQNSINKITVDQGTKIDRGLVKSLLKHGFEENKLQNGQTVYMPKSSAPQIEDFPYE